MITLLQINYAVVLGDVCPIVHVSCLWLLLASPRGSGRSQRPASELPEEEDGAEYKSAGQVNGRGAGVRTAWQQPFLDLELSKQQPVRREAMEETNSSVAR
jgi:hypothetical protein